MTKTKFTLKTQVSPKVVAVSFGVLVLLFAISFYIFAWQEPTSAPPGGNVPAPLNVGSEPQTKIGDLNIGGGLPYQLTKLGDSFALKNNAGEIKFVLGQDGKVGIGTTNPVQKLHISGGNLLIDQGNSLYVGSSARFYSDNNYLRYVGPRNFYITSAVPRTYIYSDNIYLGAGSGDNIRFRANTLRGDNWIINSGAMMGLGRTNPSYRLDVVGDINVHSSYAYRRGGEEGLSLTCADGEVLQNPVVSGGIITAGECATVGTGLPGLPPEAKIVFVTSQTYNGNLKSAGGGATGLDGANNICQQRANAACTANPSSPICGRTFRAWISTDSVSAISNMQCADNKVYTLLTGDVIANGCGELTDGNIGHTINVTEFGGTFPGTYGDVWTGTDYTGLPARGGDLYQAVCGHPAGSYGAWEGTVYYGTTGSTAQKTLEYCSSRTKTWTTHAYGGTCEDRYYCTQDKHLYCFEI